MSGTSLSGADTFLRKHNMLESRYVLVGALCLWKENKSDTNPNAFWGVYGRPFGPGTPQPKRVLLTSRATPMATAGTLESVSYSPYKHKFEVRGQAKRVRCGDRVHATLLWVPLHVRVPAAGARLDVFRRTYGQDV